MSNTDKKEDLIFLNTNRDLIFNEDFKPTQDSFGNKTLAVNVQETENAIQKLEYTKQIFGKQKSQWMLKHLTLSNEDDWTRLRQISAEMNSKQRALRDAKYTYLKNKAKINIKKEEMESASPANIKLLEIEIAEIQESIQADFYVIENAMKEVQHLADLHDQLTSRMGDLTEEEFEKNQTKAQLKRVIRQSIRDIRHIGSISVGNQEFLEQCGVAPTHAFNLIKEYLEQEINVTNTSMLHSFVEQVAENLEPCASVQIKLNGFDAEVNKQLLFNGEK